MKKTFNLQDHLDHSHLNLTEDLIVSVFQSPSHHSLVSPVLESDRSHDSSLFLFYAPTVPQITQNINRKTLFLKLQE